MKPEDYIEKLNRYLKMKNLKQSRTRLEILKALIKKEKHFTVEEFYRSLTIKTGIASVYRSLKLFCDANICSSFTLADGTNRYELLSEDHHDHIICQSCGDMTEIHSPEIEALQKKIAADNGYLLKDHKLELYGLCPLCRKK